MGLLDGMLALAQNINKTKSVEPQDTDQGVVSDLAPEVEQVLKSDEELIILKDIWIKAWQD